MPVGDEIVTNVCEESRSIWRPESGHYSSGPLAYNNALTKAGGMTAYVTDVYF